MSEKCLMGSVLFVVTLSLAACEKKAKKVLLKELEKKSTKRWSKPGGR